MTTQTDAEHIQELRDSADEAQAARIEVITEIARLTTALRQAEAERAAARADAVALERDAERLADALIAAQKSITFETEQEARESGWSLPITVAFKMRDALAAHRAASGKAVTR